MKRDVPVITYQRESIASAMPEAAKLLEQHYQELTWRKDKIALAPDEKRYRELDRLGFLRVYTARKRGRLIGYAVYMVGPHLHYKQTIYANNDVLFIDPEERGMAGIKLIRFAEADLAAQGVQVVCLHVKAYNDWGVLAKRMGYDPTDTVYQKWVGE